MENEVKLTKLASCAGCGAKVGAGTLCNLLAGFQTHYDANLLVGYDKSDDASVYRVSDELAIVQTTDFFPPIVDDPFMYGQIAATNALSDVYAMGGEPKLALNIMCIPEKMDKATVQEILRGGYAKAYEAGAIITGGHTIHGAEPIYGLAVTGFVKPENVWTNSGAQPGDVLLLTKPLGVGILTTAAKAGLVEQELLDKLYVQMSTLNKYAHAPACAVPDRADTAGACVFFVCPFLTLRLFHARSKVREVAQVRLWLRRTGRTPSHHHRESRRQGASGSHPIEGCCSCA